MSIDRYKEEDKHINTNNILYKNYINMGKEELNKIIYKQEKEIELMEDIIKKQKSLLERYDNLLKKCGIDVRFNKESPYMSALINMLKKIKEIIETGNDVPDIYYNEIEADITSLHLWKKATRKEIVEIINSY